MTRSLKFEDNYTIIGKIVGVHGIKGELKVQPITDDMMRFSLLESVYLNEYNKLHERVVKHVRYHKNTIILQLEDINDRTLAESYRNQYIFIPKSERMPLETGAYYIEDLIGLEVFEDDNLLGTLVDVLQPGANDVFVVRGKKEILLPAIKEVILGVDLPAKRMQVKLLEGLDEI